MKTLAAAALLCSALLSPVWSDHHAPLLSGVSEPMSPMNINVLLVKDGSEALLEVKGPYYIINPHDGIRVASGLLGKRFMIHEMEGGLKWGEEFPGIHQIYIKPRSPETAIFVNGIQYQGSVAIYGVSGMINIVNELDIESYVKGVLAPQFSASEEPEVLSALAILTRTDAYYRATRNSSSFWQVAAQEVGYQGSALVVDTSALNKAIDSTRHLILVHPENGMNLPFATAWTENSAGKTAPYFSIFRKEAFGPEKGVEAPHAQIARQESKWSYQIPKKTLAHLLDVPQIKSMELFVDQPSSKVYGVRVKDGTATYDFDFFTLQSKLGKNHIVSSDFTISQKDDAILFSGFGKGHGVGLCLYSAEALAQNGENAVKILSKFFPETYLYNLNAQPSGSEKERF
ncbi:MAG: SpoIID/LytB domain-containing protein [Verrucomicrobia bacterium]|nr:SpoIID/LytB domain-containing protein [Verrucomicrobiota bacterium]